MKKVLTGLGISAVLASTLVIGAQTATADVYYKNCAEAKAAGAAPILRDEPGYRPALDRDNDGVACE